MELKEFKQYIEKFEEEKVFDFGISSPFSWRGLYMEVSFEIIDKPMKREEVLANIEKAYTNEFYGYKGGSYKYCDHTEVNFESSPRSYTDGYYCYDWIAKLEDNEPYESQEARLVKLAFK